MIMRVCTYVFPLNKIILRDDVIIDLIVIGVELRDNMRFSVPARGEIMGSLGILLSKRAADPWRDRIMQREYYRRLT